MPLHLNVYSADAAHATLREESWGNLSWLAGSTIGNAEGLTLGRVVIRAGQCNPRHAHRNCEEALYLLQGQLRHTVDDADVILNPGDTLVVPAGIFHNAYSIGEQDADMIVAYSSADRDFVPEGSH